MSALPWYLLAFGIFLVIVGFIIAGMGRPPSQGLLHPSMRDEDIARQLQREQRGGIAPLLVLGGCVCILVSIIWRIVLFFV